MLTDLLIALERVTDRKETGNIAAMLSGVSASVLETITCGTPEEGDDVLKSLRLAYQSLLSRNKETLVEDSDSYVLGRLGTCFDIASIARQQRQSDTFIDLVLAKQHQPIIQLLSEREMRNKDLAKALSINADVISRKLKELIFAGVVIPRRSGREVYNRLSIVARNVITDAGLGTGAPTEHIESWTWEVFDEKVARLGKQIDRPNRRPDVIIGISQGGGIVAERLAARLSLTTPILSLNIDRSNASRPTFNLKSNAQIGESLNVLNPKRALLVDDKTCSGTVLKFAASFLVNKWPPLEKPKSRLRTAVVVYGRNSSFVPTYFSYEMDTVGDSRGVKLPSSRPNSVA